MPRLSRRQSLMLMGSVAVLPAVALAQAPRPARLVVLSDLHSAYERSARLLAAITAEAPDAILINGDVFELGNVVATRSEGVIDWELLARFAALAPTFLNIGNHEPDLINDPADIIARAAEAGVTVLSNILDSRTGVPFAPASATLLLGDLSLSLVAMATDAVNTYPAPTREMMTIPHAPDWAAENLAGAIAEGSLPVVLSHAGVVQDRAILPLVPAGSVMIGGHDHLTLMAEEGGVLYLHTGSWSSLYTVVEIAADRSLTARQVAVPLDGPEDADLAALIEATLARHLTDEERATVATTDAAMALGESARFVAEVMAGAAGADVGFIGHTTFGTGLPAGAVSKYVFDSVVRFDGKLMVAEVPRAVAEEIIARSNQDDDRALSARTGDFLYAAPTDLPMGETIRIATGDWPAINQMAYFGRDDLVFSEVPDLRIKALVTDALGN